MKFSIHFFSKCDQIRSFFAELITFTEEILNGKLHFLCSGKTSGKELWRKMGQQKNIQTLIAKVLNLKNTMVQEYNMKFFQHKNL